MPITDKIAQAADRLREVRCNASAIDGLPSSTAPQSLEEAYRVQLVLNQLLATSGLGKQVGYKIGCTTEVMQQYLNIPHPCAGTLFQSTVFTGHGDYQSSRLCRAGVECEIAVQIGGDIIEADETSHDKLAGYVGLVFASIELVDDRWTDFSKVKTPCLVADNFFNAGCVFSEGTDIDPQDLDQLRGSMQINGKMIGTGTGRDILEHPLKALAWLARHQINLGEPLKEGQLVSLGSVVKTVWIDPGDRV